MMELIMLLLSVMCVGIVLVTSVKNSKLVREHTLAKKEYLTAKASYVQLDTKYSEVSDLCKSLAKTCSEMNDKLEYCTLQLRDCNTRITRLEKENARLKTILRVKDENIAPMSKVVPIG